MPSIELRRNHLKHTRRIKTRKMSGGVATLQSLEGSISALDTTVKSMFDYMKNGFSSVTARLDVVEKDISSLKMDVSALKTDVSALKTDVSVLKVNMNVVNDHMVKVNKYIKLESDFQENSDIAFISKMYLYNHPLRFATVLPIDNFYPPKGNDYITELDGFMLISMAPNQILLWNDTRNNRNINASFIQSLKNNQDKIIYDPAQTEYIIIESKHAMSKGKVDKKIRQLRKIYDVLSNANTVSISKEYNTMIQRITQYLHRPATELLYHLNLIFASDDIPIELVNYIMAIYEGMDEVTYDRLTYALYKSDIYVTKDIDRIKEVKDLPKTYKAFFSGEDMTMSKLRETLLQKPYVNHVSPYLREYLVSFSELEPLFQFMKGSIGVSQFNKIHMPRLFPKASMNTV